MVIVARYQPAVKRLHGAPFDFSTSINHNGKVLPARRHNTLVPKERDSVMLKRLYSVVPFWGWVIIGTGMVIMCVVGGYGYYSPSVYLLPLQSYFEVNRTAVSLGGSLTTLGSGAMALLVGIVVDRWGPRRSIIFGVAGLAASFLLLSLMTELWQYYALLTFQGMVLPFAGLIPHQSLIGLWFVRRRGSAMGMMMAGLGIGGLLFPWLNGLLIESLGWQSAYLTGGIILGAIPLSAALILLRDCPEQVGQYPDGMPTTVDVSAFPTSGATLKQAVRSFAFWELALTVLLWAINNGVIMLHLPAMLQDTGMPLKHAGGVLGLMLGVSIIGRLGIGRLADRFEPRIIMGVVIICMGLSSLPLLAPANPTMRSLFVVLYGVAQGGGVTVIPLVVQPLFGMRAFGKIYGLIVVGMTVGLSIGNYLGGQIYDLKGGYTWAVLVASVAGLLAGLLPLALRRPD